MKTFKLAVLAGALLLSPFSHAQQADMRIDATQRGQVIDALIGEVDHNYVFPEQAKKVGAVLRQHQKRGDYNAITSAE